MDAPILSEAILPPSEDALQYLAGHAAKCFASDEAKGVNGQVLTVDNGMTI